MTVKHENLPRDGGFVLSELETYSRDIVTIATGNNLRAGTVLAQLQSGEWAPIDFAGTGMAADAAGLLFGDVDATDADADGVAIVRGPCEVKAGELVWPSGASDQNKADALAQLEQLGIVARSGPGTVQVGP